MIGIIEYGAGNTGNVLRALSRLGVASRLLETPNDLRDASTLLLPGVGAFGPAVERLRTTGWADALLRWNGLGKPILGICLGHQLLGLALGGETYKLPFGHHGGNHPVKDLRTGRCAVTSQNHNYALRPDFSGDAAITHVNVNDGTVEGFRHTSLPVMSVQFHPEAAPGPHDSASIFDEFLSLVENANA